MDTLRPTRVPKTGEIAPTVERRSLERAVGPTSLQSAVGTKNRMVSHLWRIAPPEYWGRPSTGGVEEDSRDDPDDEVCAHMKRICTTAHLYSAPQDVGFTAVVSAVDPLARSSALRVNRGRNGFLCGSVVLTIRRWVNIIAHRYRVGYRTGAKRPSPGPMGMVYAGCCIRTSENPSSETVWKMAEGVSIVYVRWHRTAKLGFSSPFAHS
jgi:hypothetical protein